MGEQKQEPKKTLFTQYIKNQQPSDYSPELLEAVAKALHAEMKKRGLWNAPPAWLGYKDWSHWDENRNGNRACKKVLPKYSDAFNDLFVTCYITTIIEPLPKLQAQPKTFDNIDTLIFRNINYFISNLQRKNDPLGYNVAQQAKNAIHCAIDKGIFAPSDLNHDGNVSNKTLLTIYSFDTSITPSEKAFILEVLRNNPTWKDIRLKLAGKSQTVQEPLCQIVCQLTEAGILCFRFKVLVDAMKEDVRVAKDKSDAECMAKAAASEIENTAIEELDEDSYQIVQLTEPDHLRYEDHESFLELVKQFGEAIDRLKYQPRVRNRLHQEIVEIVDSIEREDIVPSQAELVKRLNISKATLSGDMKILRKVAQQIKLNNLK